MAINLQSLSLTSAFNSIVNFFRSQENNERWKALTSTGAEGTFLIRLLANIFSTLSYRIVAQSRENYLSTAALISSNIGLSVNLGYSVFRGSNLKRLIRITPNGNYTLPKLSQIGTYNGQYNIYTLDDVDLIKDKIEEVRTVVGNIKEETIVAGTSAIKVFSLFTTGISEDYVLYLGSQEVPTTNVIKNMTEDKYLVRTNPYSSVDIMYLNTFSNAKYTYGTDSEITIRYIELADVGNDAYTSDMFRTYGTLNGVSNISSYLPFESVDSIKVRAPLDHETQNLIRSKQDYANRLLQIVPSTIDTDWVAVTPTYTQITYLKNDYTMLSDSEEEGVLKILKDENYFGTPLPDIANPRREVAHLAIQMTLNNKYKNVADINLDVENILESYYNAVLGATFNTFDLERKIESLSYVKYARVNHIQNERKPNTQYQLGYMVTHDGSVYRASKIMGIAGSELPVWNTPPVNNPPKEFDTGLLTYDGSIVWRTYKRLPNMPSLNFTERKILRGEGAQYFGIGDFVYAAGVKDYMFKCVDIRKSSGFKIPDLSAAEAGDFFVDGNIVWVAKDYSDTYELWTSAHTYSLGDSVNVPSSTSFSLECVSYTGSTGPEVDLDFELSEYPIEAQTTNTFTLAGDRTYFFQEDEEFSATYREGATSFKVLSSVYNGTNTIITTVQTISSDIEYKALVSAQKGTKDGQILWTVVNNPENIEYPWNSYVTYDYTLEILE